MSFCDFLVNQSYLWSFSCHKMKIFCINDWFLSYINGLFVLMISIISKRATFIHIFILLFCIFETKEEV